jgi:hypothetical protein
MGAYSSLRITRTKALQVFLEHVVGEIPDKVLEQHLDLILEPRLYNAVIVPDGYEDNDDHEL